MARSATGARRGAELRAIPPGRPQARPGGPPSCALVYPPRDRRQIEAFLAALRQSIERIEERELQTEEQFGDAMHPAGAPARRYGIAECGYG